MGDNPFDYWVIDIDNKTGKPLLPRKVVSMKEPEEPKIVYVSGRTFWDYLAEMERPKRKTLWKVLICVLLALLAVGAGFFMAWFSHFGAEWAIEPVQALGFSIIVGSTLGVLAIIGLSIDI